MLQLLQSVLNLDVNNCVFAKNKLVAQRCFYCTVNKSKGLFSTRTSVRIFTEVISEKQKLS